MLSFELENHLHTHCKQNIRLTINDNRSTMLNVRWEESCTKISLHRIFLSAPKNVILALADSILEKQTTVASPVKAFIQESIEDIDYSSKIDPLDLYHQGEIHNVKHYYDELNNEYFNNSLNLQISWFGDSNKRNKNKISFGLYHDALRLIKINRIMDTSIFPSYVIRFIIYHEMLHCVCPPYVDEKGIHRIHHKEFKAREKEFKDFSIAIKWIQQHRHNLFIPQVA